MSDQVDFVRASELYHVPTGNTIRHPAESCTEEELRAAVEEIVPDVPLEEGSS